MRISIYNLKMAKSPRYKKTRGASSTTITVLLTENYANGDFFEGQYDLDGFREGHGKMSYHSGTIYEGEHSRGDREGDGKVSYQNGSIFEGQFLKGKPDGFGKLICANGDTFEGMFRNGVK